MLLMKLNNRVKLLKESVIQYWTDIELLCACFDNNLMEHKFCAYILKEINPLILQQISMLDNTTLDKLNTNIKAYEGILLNAAMLRV